MIKKLLSILSIVILIGVGCENDSDDDVYNGVYVEDITISGTSLSGLTYTASESGKYRLKIKSGAINVYPGDNPTIGVYGWTTQLVIYKNRPIDRDEIENPSMNPKNWDYSLGGNDPELSEHTAEDQGIGKYVDIQMNAGYYIIIVAIDGAFCEGPLSCYIDNLGSINLEIFRE